MLAIQNQKTLWRKRRQKQNQDTQPCQIRWSKSRTNSYAESARTKPT